MGYDSHSTAAGDFSQMPGIAYADAAWAKANGYPPVLAGESLLSYMNRIYPPHTQWHAGGSGIISAIGADITGAAVGAALDALSVLAAPIPGGPGALQSVNAQVQAGVSADAAAATAGGGGGRTYSASVAGAIHQTAANVSEAVGLWRLLHVAPSLASIIAPLQRLPSPPKAPLRMRIAIPQPVAKALATINPSGGWAQTLNPNTMDALAPQAPAPPPPSTPWYSKPLVGPVTVGEAGILAIGAGILAKVMGK